MRVLIIGGGAGGMLAALTAAEAGHAVTLLERQARVGRKLLATGNGRCNLSHLDAAATHYHGADPDFVRPALRRFDAAATLDYFQTLGLMTVAEADGRVYPYSDSANSVVDVLRLALDRAAVTVRTGCEVLAATGALDDFHVRVREAETERELTADRLIVAMGGAAGGRLGGCRDGYRLLQGFGHSCTALYPALVQLKTEPTWVRSLKGVRATGRVALVQDGRETAASRGEIQFTEYGLSGPAVFEISRAAAQATAASQPQLVLDLCPQYDREELRRWLERRQAAFPALPLEDFLTGTLHNRLGRVLLRAGGFAATAPAASLAPADLARIAALIHAFALPLRGALGFEQAQVTAGGIRTAEFDPATLESRLCPGLFAVGEVLDIDGDCGGYNLQWAWSSGRLAGLLGAADA